MLYQAGSANLSLAGTMEINRSKEFGKTIKAIVYKKFGLPDVLHLEEVM